MLNLFRQANQNGSEDINKSLHVQRIASETLAREYNLATSPLLPYGMNRYAELIRNYKN